MVRLEMSTPHRKYNVSRFPALHLSPRLRVASATVPGPVRVFAYMWLLAGLAPGADDPPIRFSRDVAPILQRRCVGCHGEDLSEGSYRLDSFAALKRSGDSGVPTVLPADSTASELWRRITSSDETERMPSDADPLPDAEVEIIRSWIDQGAEFDGVDVRADLATLIPISQHPAAPTIYPHAAPLAALCFSPDGQHILAGGYHEVTIWDISTGSLVRRMGNLEQRTLDLDFTSDGSLLIVAGGTPGISGEVRILDFRSGEAREVLPRERKLLRTAQSSPDGQKIAVGSSTGNVSIWQLTPLTRLHLLPAHSDWCNAVRWNHDGTQLVTVGRDKSCKLFETAGGQRQVTYAGHKANVRAVMFHPHEPLIYSADAGGTVHRWNVSDGKQNKSVWSGHHEIYALERIHGRLLAGTTKPSVLEFVLDEEQQQQAFPDFPDWVTSLAVHHDARRWACGTHAGTVHVFDLGTSRPIAEFLAYPRQHTSP